MQHDDRASGQWVFRNHRWCYVPRNIAELEVAAPHLTPGRLWSFLDLAGLLKQLRSAHALCTIPLVAALETRDQIQQETGEKYREPDRIEWFPPYWCAPEHNSSFLSDFCTSELLHAASRGLAQRTPLTLPSIWGHDALRVLPLLIRDGSSVVSLGAVGMVLLDKGRFPSSGDVLAVMQQVGAPQNIDPESIWNSLPPAGSADLLYRLLGDLLGTFRRNAEREVAGKLELASEQARSRQLLLRVESLEQQVLKGSGELAHATDFGDLPRSELEAVLSLPEVGIIIEDTNYRIRYLNPYMRRHFGDAIGRLCYETVNKGTEPCAVCPIKKLWGEGRASFRYNTRASTSGQVFEIIAVPFISQRGEKLVLEVGLNMTELHAEKERLSQELLRSSSRNTELQELTRALNMVVFDYFQEIQEVLELTQSAVRRERQTHEELFLDPSLPLSAWERQLSSSLDRLGTLVADSRRLSLSLGSVGLSTTVDLKSLLTTMSSSTTGLWRELPTPEVGDFPPIETNRAALAILLGVWMRSALDRHGNPGARPFVWYTASGSPDALAPGDGYHVVALRCVDSTLTPRPGAFFGKRGARSFDASQITLLARYLGGKVREEAAPSGVQHFLSLPKTPPRDMRRL